MKTLNFAVNTFDFGQKFYCFLIILPVLRVNRSVR